MKTVQQKLETTTPRTLANATELTTLKAWYTAEFNRRTRAIADGVVNLDWAIPEYRVSWTEVSSKAEELGITMNVVDLRLALEREAAQSLEATRLLTQQVTEQAATIAELRAALDALTASAPKTISAAAREIGIAADTLREYERRGIVSPTRDSSARRLYSATDIEVVRRYRAARDYVVEV